MIFEYFCSKHWYYPQVLYIHRISQHGFVFQSFLINMKNKINLFGEIIV